jgi:hypothetical protein
VAFCERAEELLPHGVSDIFDRFANLSPGGTIPFTELATRSIGCAFILQLSIIENATRCLFHVTFDLIELSFDFILIR